MQAFLQDCASKPNVYLAHHSTLDLNSLNDQVHLYKAAIPTFARALKEVTLNRSPRTSHRSNRQPAQTSETPSQTCKTPP